MIYSVGNKSAYTESVALFGQDADEFLESVEVSLYEDTVAISENVYDGAEAEKFLAENGILLYEDHIVLEGRQALAYKNRKDSERTQQGNANYQDYQRTLDRGTSPYAKRMIKHAEAKKYIDTKDLSVKNKEGFEKLADAHEK